MLPVEIGLPKRSLSLTQGAVNKLKAMISQENKPDLKLRVYITGGGCSGFQYGFEFEQQTGPNDTEIVVDDVTVVVDEASLPLLSGAEVDYQDDLTGSRFVINNPNATATCGCGSSFSV